MSKSQGVLPMDRFHDKYDKAVEIIEQQIPMELEDIIDACQKKYDGKTALQLLSLMRVQISKLYCDNYLHMQTTKDLWFLFFMATIHKRKWGNKGWEHV